MDIERCNDLFVNAPRPFLTTAALDDKLLADRDAGIGLSTLIPWTTRTTGICARSARTGFSQRRCGS